MGLPLKGELTVRHFSGGALRSEETYCQTITTVGKNWICDVMQEVDAADDAAKWHQSGTGATAAAAGDTDLGTALYTRTSGTQTEGGSANIYKSVATISYTGSQSVTEWGIFTTSTSGTLISRKTFSAKSVGNGDSIEFTWQLTIG
jgi:hypothetical protein